MGFNGALARREPEFCALGPGIIFADLGGEDRAWKIIYQISLDRKVLHAFPDTGDMGVFCVDGSGPAWPVSGRVVSFCGRGDRRQR